LTKYFFSVIIFIKEGRASFIFSYEQTKNIIEKGAGGHKMIKIALVEDTQECADLFKEFVDRYRAEGNSVELKWFKDGLDFIDEYKHEYDVVFMDIEMPHISGLETAAKLRKIDPSVPLIFVTVMAQLAIKGYEVSAMDFIVKPITYFNFCLKLEKAVNINRHSRNVTLKLMDDDGGKVIVSATDVQYIESIGHRCIFHTERGNFYQYGSLSDLEEKLEENQFLRCNNSFLINPIFVTKINKDSIVITGNEIPVARARKKVFMEKLTKYYKHIF